MRVFLRALARGVQSRAWRRNHVRRFAGLLSLLTVACALPEDGNPTPRCTVDAHCPEAMRCYRSYCIADEDADTDAGVTTIDIGEGWRDAGLGALDASARDAGTTLATSYVDAGAIQVPEEAAAPVPPTPSKPPPPPKPKEPKPKPGGPAAMSGPGAGPGRAPPAPPH